MPDNTPPVSQQGLPLGMAFRWVLIVTLLLGGVLSVIIPPRKSPDEEGHIIRAYLLSQGHFFLKTKSCQGESAQCHNGSTMSGGMVDKGLIEYLEQYDPYRRNKENLLDQKATESIRWRGEEEFSYTPGTGYYFPLVYLPQASALAIGKAWGLTVERSYYLARAFAMLAGAATIALAFYIFWPQPVVIALMLLPMSIFQMASASIDFLCNALAILAISCFLRLLALRRGSAEGLFWLMAVVVFLLGTARAHLAPMVLLMAVAALPTRRVWPWVAVATATLAIMIWMALAIPNTVDFRIPREVSTAQVVFYYLSAPTKLVSVLVQTLTDRVMLNSYVGSFLGVFFDQPLSRGAYAYVGGLLGLVILPCLVTPKQFVQTLMPRSALMLTGMTGIFLAFLAMLFTWTPHPATVIQGVQGRYLLVPVMLLLLAVCSWKPAMTAWLRSLRIVMLVAFGLVSLLISVCKLIQAFYVPVFSVGPVTAKAMAREGVVEPGPLLVPGHPMVFRLVSDVSDNAIPMTEALGFMVGTYGQTLKGTASLMLTDVGGQRHQVDVDLDDVVDNSYVFVRIPSGRYVDMELKLTNGATAFSVWRFHPAVGDNERPENGYVRNACVVLIHQQDRTMQVTPGCPAPR